MLLFVDKTREEFEERVRDLNDTILNLQLQKKLDLAVSEQLFDTEPTTETEAKAAGEEDNFCKQDGGKEDQVFGVRYVKNVWIRIRSSFRRCF